VYGRVLIERVSEITEVQIRDEQCGFRKGRGGVDQVFALKCVCEKYLERQKEVFVAFMGLEKAYDRVDRMAMWEVLGMYGVGGKILGVIKNMYEESTVCVRIGRKLGRKFKVDVGLRQGCVMSPWLFNIFIDGMVREVNARVLERGAALISGVGGEW
jgi:hypothetical protein